ncbi:LuxR C-terminal-related transcriptional regulator [Streptomyces sp. NPDC017940]|uniref:helix-turn-helix transcriptional regulator n=1 Tax=Streptomyces sp. NPDC017940 TaxID=3365017 RepID=UPI00379C2FD9
MLVARFTAVFVVAVLFERGGSLADLAVPACVSALETVSGAADCREILAQLPHRQAQVLLLTADGWSDSQIGDQLGLSAATVRSHRRHMEKFCSERFPRHDQCDAAGRGHLLGDRS